MNLLTLTTFFFYCYVDHRDLHSFPTRRSSDLVLTDCSTEVAKGEVVVVCGPSGSGKSTTTSPRSEEHTSELQSRFDLVCRLLLEKKKKKNNYCKQLKN